MSDEERTSAAIDLTRPNVGRVYDYLIGGKDNFTVDRKVGEEIVSLVPEAREVAATNRAFLRRAVRYMVAEAGIGQFLDIGSGLPTQGNVHEIAQELDPGAKVAYVDIDPVVLTHTRALLENRETTAAVMADLRRPEQIIDDPTVRDFLDFDRPIGLLMLGILHHLSDEEDPVGVSARLRDALAPGSHLAITHFHNPGEELPEEAAIAAASERQLVERFGSGWWRGRDDILACFGDFELIEPGLVPMATWRPDALDRSASTRVFRRALGGAPITGCGGASGPGLAGAAATRELAALLGFLGGHYPRLHAGAVRLAV